MRIRCIPGLGLSTAPAHHGRQAELFDIGVVAKDKGISMDQTGRVSVTVDGTPAAR